MIATLTRFILLLQMGMLVALTWLALRMGLFDSQAMALLASAALIVLLRFGIVFNNYLLSRALWQRMANGTHAPVLAMLACILQEFWCSSLCWFRWFPFARPVLFVAPGDHSPPVLMLHGFGANSGFWIPLSRSLRAAGISHATIDLEPVLGSIDEYSPLIHAQAELLCKAAGARELIVIGHSMGGLAARAWMRNAPLNRSDVRATAALEAQVTDASPPRSDARSPEEEARTLRVVKLITLGTPHFGSWLASYGAGRNTMQMVPPGADPDAWLNRLDRSETAEMRKRVLSIWSRHDNIVAPQTSSVLPGAEMIALDLIGHVALGFDPAVLDRVMQAVNSVRQSRSTTGSR